MKAAFRGASIPPSQLPGAADPVHQVPSFAGGFDDRTSVENQPVGTSQDMLDVEVTLDDSLIVAPGVTQVEVEAHAPTQVILHPGFRYSSELLFLAPPFMGVKSNGATAWYSIGLNGIEPFGWTDFAGVLLLSNGVGGIYSRQPGATALALIPGAPPALGLTTFAERVVLGATIVSGDFDMMGIGWSDATNDYAGWDQDNGAGSEAMIGSMKRADRFMAFAPLGFDLLAVINRRSVWIGRRTGDVFEPIDLSPRLEDTGTTHAATVVTSKYGALYLSDDGVKLFEGSTETILSEQINNVLGRIHEVDQYSASFNPQLQRYYLHTPTETWVLDLNKKRWYRWGNQFLASVWFPVQGAAGPTWDSAVGTWDSQTLAWWQLEPQETDGSMYFVRGTLLGVEDPAAGSVFGVATAPKWNGRLEVGELQDTLMTHLMAYLTYESTASSTVQLWLPDVNGDYELTATAVLPSSAGKTRRIAIPAGVPTHTGRGVGLGLKITSGAPRIRRGSVRYQPTSMI